MQTSLLFLLSPASIFLDQGSRFETKNDQIKVSTSRPKLGILESQFRDRDYESESLSDETNTETKIIGLNIETDNEPETECK